MRDLTRHGRPVAGGSGPSGNRRPGRSLAIVTIAALAAACAPTSTQQPAPASMVPATAAAVSSAPTEALPPIASPRSSATAAQALRVSVLALHLPEAVSRAVAFADGSSLLLAGGLTPAGTTATVVRIDLSAGTVTIVGHLAKAVHDAGGALVAGSPTLFGGGNVVPETVVQRYAGGQSTVLGQLPRARADLVVVDVGGMAVVVGGGTPARLDRAVLTTTDGAHFQTIGSLLEGVRYPAVAAIGGAIIVAGGTDGARDRTEIQAIDPASGSVRIIGRLPMGLSHAAAFVIAGRLLIAGGRTGGVAQDSIWEVDPASGTVRSAGRLPQAISDAAAAVVGDVGYLIGGERGAAVMSVISISVG